MGRILWFCRIEDGFAFFACEILRNCGIADGLRFKKGERILLLAKAKSSKNFFRFCVVESGVDLRFCV